MDQAMKISPVARRFYCTQCNKNFSLKADLKRHVKSIHEGRLYKCDVCTKTFNQSGNLKRHRAICRGKCPRCGEESSAVMNLTEHMKLCSGLTCNICEENFTSKNQLNEHMRIHRKRKSPTVTIPTTSKKQKIGVFRCNICMDNFDTRKELFHHQIHIHAEPNVWTSQNIEAEFVDEELNEVIRTHASIISVGHEVGDTVSMFNFPLLLRVGSANWTSEISSILERVAEINSYEAYKVNFTLGFVLINKETDEYRYYAPGSNNTFFTKPKRIDRVSDWRDMDISQEALVQYVVHNRENTKWIPLMLTNIVVDIYHLGVAMGAGQLPDFIKNSHCIRGLEMSNNDRN